nr:trehalase family glycosidase [Microbacterium sp. KUDC0406]
MDGVDDLREGQAHRHCVRLPDGAVLNRYWDDRDTPREESFIEDVTTAQRSSRPAHEVYRDLRAAAASGWDFSSRWCESPDELATTVTTRIAPVDLNSFLYELEHVIAGLADRAGDDADAAFFHERAADRKAAINTWLWDTADGAYCDLDLSVNERRTSLTAACVAPLWVGVASDQQAERTAATVRKRLLRPGGLGTSEHATGQQWDRPNGWAPLQWIAVKGLERYNQPLAGEIAERWLRGVRAVYEKQQKLVEKYAMLHAPEATEGGGGGEYPLQDGFGWTNGVVAALLKDAAK